MAEVASPTVVQQWQFMPLIRVENVARKVKRSSGGVLTESEKKRPICYASHRDAAVYEYYSRILSDKYEHRIRSAGFSSSITAFRQGLRKCNIHFATDAFSEISDRDSCVALAFDIKSFFDRLNHQILKSMWCEVLNVESLPSDHFHVFKSVTRYATVERDVLYKRLSISKYNPRANSRQRICTPIEFRDVIRKEELIATNEEKYGIPQGLPISAVLSNIYLLNFDSAVHEYCVANGAAYFRYCDDILVVSPVANGAKTKAFIENIIAASKLEIQTTKTTEHTFSSGVLTTGKPLQYLGFTFDGTTVLLRNAGLTRY